ncbi:heavy metal transporter [Streptomyces sp. NBC_00078]|uniref:heavy metal transporter n=1 Tax=unclassified Streptomyces TaxID=2593676 RepID=UPI0022557A65|nr:heavy metal transporter [Streptomyces sp. NBC_00078]MCX5423427.1 heavy metal transporter [Streptomyces sp. NBC_00078]
MPEPSPTLRRRGRLFRIGAAFVVLLAVAGYLAVQYVTGGSGAPGCKVVSDEAGGTTFEFTPEQAVNAATIAAVGTGRGMPERAVTIALATSLQESGLRNIEHGDRDSIGLFQQRPSQGWGTRKQILDPTYAAGVFYQHLAKVRDYPKLPLTVAAQRVQRSGFPEAYARHEMDATLLSAALTGHSAATLTCDGRPAGTRAAGPDAVRAALVRDFGRDALQPAGAEVGAATTPTPSAAPSTRAPARTVTLPVDQDASPAKGRSVRQRGWQLAHWAVANSSALHIEGVSYGGREWIAGNTDSEWRTAAEGARTTAGAVRIVTGQ